MEWIFIDANHVRAHQPATGIKDQYISKNIGGNSSKIYLAVDASGNLIEFMIAEGTIHDAKAALTLIDRLDLEDTNIWCADTGYDSDFSERKSKRPKPNTPKKPNSTSNNIHI